MDQIVFRPFEAKDQNGVWDLHSATLIGTFAVFEEDGWDSDLDNVTEVYVNQNGAFLVGELDGDVVAMGALAPLDETTVMIKRLRVLPEVQRQGIGGRLMRRLETEAKQLGYKSITLDITRQQQVAKKLLSREGFEETGAHLAGAYVIDSYAKDLA